MLGARSVAVVGASARPDSFGARMIVEAQRSSARMHLVNPRYDRIGDAAVRTVAGRPRRARRPGAARRARRRAGRPAGGGRRGRGPVGRAVRLRARGCATRWPPSRPTPGWRCAARAAWASSTTRSACARSAIWSRIPLPAGGVSLVTHSGSAFSTLLRARRGFGFRLAVSSGQELVTDTADYVEYALDDPGTTVVALLMETPRAVPRLRRGAARAPTTATCRW